MSTLQLEPDISNLTLLDIQLLTPLHVISACALINSGSSGNFISPTLKQLGLPRPRKKELKVESIQGKLLGRGRIQFRSPPVTLQIGCLYSERISFLVLEGPTVDVILGCPWLSQHPVFRKDRSEILRWSPACFQNCLSNVPVPPVSDPVQSTLVESPKPHTTPIIPSDYMAFQDVFSKQVATKLLPLQPWDSTIDLLPAATPPKGRVYPRPSRSARL